MSRGRGRPAAGVLAAGWLMLAAWLGGCGPAAGPVPIHYGSDRCAECHMLIVHRRFAAQLLERDGRREKFDDLGCLLQWVAAHGGWGGVQAAWVKDYRTRRWLPVQQAAYVYDPGVASPMGYDLLAFRSRAAAAAVMDRQREPGLVLSFAGLLHRRWQPHLPRPMRTGSG
ncbi:conserved protein of unknown function [Candidatus Hydrogenisulfobacillus filiaventi]|uniref:Uncharacterized protein n=1 Tax=Candidatus Hydrogenisulfobacillus filiaventi TaxID=2707344 RepID=A0A6F8ZH95_9FIRM|nr:nitrous oxide reductase accessory protein NosL [Bacillota bacterium]CAB1128825.1 conserved protein of unknown function [Candidatus Hydrogenisulfobacillus filiaventi]